MLVDGPKLRRNSGVHGAIVAFPALNVNAHAKANDV
jgi:hypothetical protein